MRIHTNATGPDILRAAILAGVGFINLSEHGSRRRDRSFDVTLTGASGRRANHHPDKYAATWDQWGVFLAEVFRVDPESWSVYYADAGDFAWQTDDRFGDGWPRDHHGDHTWEFNTVGVQSCKHCAAVKRWSLT